MRLFVAVWPPEPVVAQVAALARPEVAELRWTSPDQWHVTLRFLGSVPDDDVPALRAALVAGVGAVGPVTAKAGPAVGRFGRRILHVPVAGLEEVAGAVIDATAGFGEPPGDRAFTGHLTLARARGRGRGRGPDLRPLTGAAVVGEWRVEEVTLVESRLSPKGARYEVVGRFPLPG
jgi:2'-5' RNA ligase